MIAVRFLRDWFRAGNRGPALRNRINSGFGDSSRSERSAIVKVCAAIPRSIPRLTDRFSLRVRRHGCGRLGLPRQLAQGEQLSEIFQRTYFKPGEPNTLAFAAQSNAVETIVPIASSDQGQSMAADAGGSRDGAPAMFEQRTFRVGNDRNGKALRLLVLQWFAFEERNHLIENRGVAGSRT